MRCPSCKGIMIPCGIDTSTGKLIWRCFPCGIIKIKREIAVNIDKLLQELDDVSGWVSGWDSDETSRSHLVSLCKQAAHALREYQSQRAFEQSRLTTLARGLESLGKTLQGHHA